MKNNIKIIIAFILGLIISGVSVYAATIGSNLVTYSRSGSDVENVEDTYVFRLVIEQLV